MFPFCNSFIRTVHRPFLLFSRNCTKYEKSANPGVDYRLEVLEPDNEELMDPDFVDNAESSFWNAGEMHKVFEREEFHHRQQKGFHQVTRKYFKEDKYPNMLTWEEKEQIRSLHEQDPELWTVAKLAISFPASPSIIEKVIKAKWRHQTPQGIARHDRAVHLNWKKLLAGKLDIPDSILVEHLLQFSHQRQMPNTTVKDVALSMGSETDAEVQSGVFSNILKSYSFNEGSSHTPDRKEHPKEGNASNLKYSPKNDTFSIQNNVINANRYKNLTTLDSLRKKVLESEQKGKTLNEVEKAIIHNVKNDGEQKFKALKDPIGVHPLNDTSSAGEELNAEESRTEVLDVNSPDIIAMHDGSVTTKHIKNEKFITKFNSSVGESAIKNYMSAHIDHYPLKIEIPKDKRKKGFIYRVKDRFYADDGEFLYRVPGLSKE